jgi:hypothetical protein
MLEAETISIIVSTIERLGIVGTLIIIVVLFLNGTILTQKMMDRAMDKMAVALEKALKTAVCEAIDEARMLWVQDMAHLTPARKSSASNVAKDLQDARKAS